MVVAMTYDGVIGNNGALPWRIPQDLAHFKSVTMGHAVIMGRRTHESIGRPLPGRRNIVVTRTCSALAGCEVAGSLDEAIALARQSDELPFIIGGARIYTEAMPLVTRIFLTRVRAAFDGDTRLSLDFGPFGEVSRSADDPAGVDFLVLDRREFQVLP